MNLTYNNKEIIYNNKPIKNVNHLIEIFNEPSEENNILNGIDNLLELDNIENEILINEYKNKIAKDI
tara:strand:+ start:313 stop:513 length:201 start_codon:yes stop_codon:yes gene_type:complete